MSSQPPLKKAKTAGPEEGVSFTGDLRVTKIAPLIPPAILLEDLPITPEVERTVLKGRMNVSNIYNGKDDRMIAVVGPCSIHDTELAMEYATRLKTLADELSKDLVVVMRVYFEKPRTTIGWKGLINDPELNGSFKINKGLRIARKLLLDINALGLPVGCEFLDTISPQFTADLVTWGAIGARTTECQLHRELASGLSMPVGFKNGTNGGVQIAVDAIRSAAHPHRFLGVTQQSLAGIVTTTGNPDCHTILRGGHSGPNYEAEHVEATLAVLKKFNLGEKIIIDCSHGNSRKIHTNQPIVAADIGKQVAAGQHGIMGVMIESNINAGNQKLVAGTPLKYGVSITDACIDWATTETTLRDLAKSVAKRRTV